ncbi:hypothetical protein MSG28_002244 [Choristoneura fumiferana]|uniref:Uncharacterized protein n=1 Tax=Choristoneura fumiferana TaxID=7141 RepID=A0ACC0JV05_CHOFU|nr:hypothetical protein MSG28_002244 [Choristoneura fumiferana]
MDVEWAQHGQRRIFARLRGAPPTLRGRTAHGGNLPHSVAPHLTQTPRRSSPIRSAQKLCAPDRNDLLSSVKLLTMIRTITIYFLVLSVTAPAVIQCAYRVAVAGGARAQTVYVAVEGKRATGELYSQGREVQIDDPGPGNYELVAQSRSGPQFASSARLAYQPRSYCVFVQTDKRVYQPGDTIKFRVVALDNTVTQDTFAFDTIADEELVRVRLRVITARSLTCSFDRYLLPLSGLIDVSVMDVGGSPVRQWGAIPLEQGIVADELILADEPALGEWTIQVEVKNQIYSRHILVADYVMPKFQMDIQMPKEMLFSDGRFTLNVTANHFNGLPVEGELTISAYAVFFSDILQPVFSNPARKVVDINGHAEVTYDLKTDLDLAEDAARPLVVEAVLEEKDTLIRQNVSSRILLLRTPYRLKVTAPEYFRPMLPYNVQIEVLDPSGQVMNVDDDVTVERLWDDGAPVNLTTIALKKGLATYSLTPAEASVGDVMRARISSTERMDILHYAVIGRGDILMAKTLELSPARRSVDVSAPVTARMAPGCVLLAWAPLLGSRDAVLAAAVRLSVGGGQRPGGSVELRVEGAPTAHAAVLAVDARAAAAGLAGSDGHGSGLDIHTNEDHLPGLGIDLGGNATFDVFTNAGVVILTDGFVQKSQLSGQLPSPSLPETGTRPPLAGPYAFSRLPTPPTPRYYLTVEPQPTWTLANFSLGLDGTGFENRVSPITSGDWLVGAFAVHPELGLGLASPRKYATSVPLTITAELPATLQRGEAIAAVITLKSTLTVDTNIEVTFHNSEQYFEFEPLENSVDSAKKIEVFRRLRVTVPARGLASTAFLVSAVRLGEAPIIVEATGDGVSASLYRTIDVKAIEEDDSVITSEARAHAAAGYQRLMAYRRPDGSFAPDTDDESTGDVWMTAVAARWLSRCARHVAAPPAAGAALRWLAAQQQPAGSWPPPAAPADPHAQRPLPTAAYALMALSQSQDPYSLAVAAGALAAARHPQAATALQMMDRYTNASGSTKFWSRKLQGNEWRNPWLKTNSLEASTAAWGLRAMLSERLIEEAVPVARYLLQAQSDLDPDVLDSLAMFAKAVRSPTNLRLSVNVTGSEEARQFNIDSHNALVVQTQLVRTARSASAITEGRGLAVVGLAAKGSTNVTAAWPRFNLDPRVDQVSTKDRLQLSICIGFKELLRRRLIECGWRDQVRMLCRDMVKENDGGNVTFDMLVNRVTPRARALVPDPVKKELLQKIKTHLLTQKDQ